MGDVADSWIRKGPNKDISTNDLARSIGLDDIDTIAGKRDQLAGKLQNSYGITKDEAEDQIESFADRYGEYDDASTRGVGPRH